MNKILIIFLLVISYANAQPVKTARNLKIVTSPLVYDTAIGYGRGTTGGLLGYTVTVTTAAEFKSAVSGSSAKTVIINGSGLVIGYTQIGSNTTIKGLTGSSLVGTLRIEGTNVIVRNVTIRAPVVGTSNQDAISVAGGTYVWIDHCTVYDWTDGAIDITIGADWVTVSWCRMYQTIDYVHSLANLIGANSTAFATDSGKLHVTWHHNFWDANIRDRMPRVRFGRVHVFNNYYSSFPAGHLIDKVSAYVTAAIESQVLVENNYFQNGEDPLYYYGGENGKMKGVGNYFDPSVTGAKTANDVVFTPPYPYTLTTPATAKTDVLAGAGAH